MTDDKLEKSELVKRVKVLEKIVKKGKLLKRDIEYAEENIDRICKICDETKLLKNFYKKTANRYDTRCKECVKQKKRSYYNKKVKEDN